MDTILFSLTQENLRILLLVPIRLYVSMQNEISGKNEGQLTFSPLGIPESLEGEDVTE